MGAVQRRRSDCLYCEQEACGRSVLSEVKSSATKKEDGAEGGGEGGVKTSFGLQKIEVWHGSGFRTTVLQDEADEAVF